MTKKQFVEWVQGYYPKLYHDAAALRGSGLGGLGATDGSVDYNQVFKGLTDILSTYRAGRLEQQRLKYDARIATVAQNQPTIFGGTTSGQTNWLPWALGAAVIGGIVVMNKDETKRPR